MKKILLVIFLFIFVLVGGFLATKNVLIKKAIQIGAKVIAGVHVDMKKFNLGIIDPKLGIWGLKVYNPNGFDNNPMLSMPEIYVDYKIMPLITQKRVVVNDIRIHLEEIVVVKNKAGLVNFSSLGKAGKKKEEDKKEMVKKEDEKKEKTETPKIEIAKLSLKAERLVFKDYSKGAEPEIKTFELKIDEQAKNITNLNLYITTVSTMILAKTTLGNLADLGGETIGAAVDAGAAILGGGSDTTKKVLDVGAGALKGLFDKK